jgi:hypothetical protein
MIKNLSQIELLVENKVCRFICDHDTSLVIVKEALFQFQKYIGQIEDAAKAEQLKQQPKEEEKISPIEQFNNEEKTQ